MEVLSRKRLQEARLYHYPRDNQSELSMLSRFRSDIYLHHSHLSYILMMESQARDPPYSLIKDTGELMTLLSLEDLTSMR